MYHRRSKRESFVRTSITKKRRVVVNRTRRTFIRAGRKRQTRPPNEPPTSKSTSNDSSRQTRRTSGRPIQYNLLVSCEDSRCPNHLAQPFHDEHETHGSLSIVTFTIGRGAYRGYSNRVHRRYSRYRARALGWHPGAHLHVVRERSVRSRALCAKTCTNSPWN